MRQHERGDAALLLQVRQIRNDPIDAEQLGIREHDAGVDDDRRLAPGERQHVHAELAEPAERDRVRAAASAGRPSSVRVASRHHERSPRRDRCGQSQAARRVDRTRGVGCAPGQARSRRRTRRDAAQSRCSTWRAAGTAQPGTAKTRADYSTAQLVGPKRRRRQAAPVLRVAASPGAGAGRCRRAVRAPRGAGAARLGDTARSAFASVFRRCVNIDRTIALERRLVRQRRPAAAGTQPDDRRVDLGARPERAGRQRQSRSHVGVELRSGSSGRRSPACPARRRADRRPRAAASPSRRTSRPPARCAVEQLEQDRRRDVVGKVAGDAQRTVGRPATARSNSRKSPSTSVDVRRAAAARAPRPGRDRSRRR